MIQMLPKIWEHGSMNGVSVWPSARSAPMFSLQMAHRPWVFVGSEDGVMMASDAVHKSAMAEVYARELPEEQEPELFVLKSIREHVQGSSHCSK